MKSYDGVNVTTSGPNVSAGIKVATTPNSFEFRAEAEANAGDSSVTFGDSSNNLRVGISDGAGMGVRYGETVNPDGSSTEHLGGDVGPFTGDVTVTHTKEQNEAFMKEMQNPTHFR